ncbi:FAD-dependent oxidoreductase [Paucibacter sp. O1-1]|uniref:NAD(P)/FAD-dependent oxidoreductase n=1 Tax=Paucibacter sp. M5-1 TaxID=3015998 RepID=UPI0021D50BE9|nr:FAD-dependent oxidoreductase [Paucibacter sp. M5-1]MCU7373872.1 FAD-binding oxidoreductase [Paucibacter sp. O1-1]MCZ7880178.1 FAD-dependent oxidoreductase [Paucibacter sp. M5-1]MDA3828874.1 FAD-dependent oxidoreductase [Paucibacter sp. O1-1]
MLIVGAGIVGAACAREFARQGLSVAVIESGAVGGGATAASMGHLLVVDDEAGGNDPEFALSQRSMRLWQDWLDESAGHAAQVEHGHCGTLWLAADDQELALAGRKQAWYAARGIAAELIDGATLARLEPMLRPGLAGALRVPGDGRVYPPKVAAHWLQGCELISGEVIGLDGQSLSLADGRRLWGGLIVLTAGLASQRWLPPGWLLPKKGQLAITQRSTPRVAHQLVELGYIKKAHLADQDTVSFNVQPRPDGQLLIGSSRQIGRSDAALDRAMLEAMLALACDYLPELAALSLLRCWTGLRPASRDGQPLIGAHPEHPRVWLACGHEGLGITTSLATAELLAQLSLGQSTLLNAAPFAPARLL